MSKLITIILEWKFSITPLENTCISSLKDIMKYIEKQHGQKLNIITNCKEYSFLSTYNTTYNDNIDLQKIKNTRCNNIIYLYFGEYYNPIIPISLIPKHLEKWNSIVVPQINNPLKQNKTIFIRADGGYQRGSGHIYRAFSIYELLYHKGYQPTIITLNTKDMNLGKLFFQDKNVSLELISHEKEFASLVKRYCPDLLILDILNTDKQEIKILKPYVRKLIAFENLGSGIFEMDLVFNDLYKHPHLSTKKQYIGLEYSLLNPYFMNAIEEKLPLFCPHLNHILILFGGTDPSHLSLKTLQALKQIQFSGKVTLIQNFQQTPIENIYPFQLEILKNITYMPECMFGIDLAISSAGRSILELISMGVPTLCMSQNEKELMHTHSIGGNGVLNIGLGSYLTVDIITQYILLCMTHPTLRKSLYENTLSARKQFSNTRIINKILSLIEN